jgi:hypothetical protein
MLLVLNLKAQAKNCSCSGDKLNAQCAVLGRGDQVTISEIKPNLNG